MDFIAGIVVTLQTIVLAPFFLVLILISELIPPTIDTNISNYETYRQELHYASEFMPEMSELSDAKSVQFAFMETEYFLGGTETISLTVQYDDDSYAAAVSDFEAGYTFISEPVIESDGDQLLDDAFTNHGFDFRAVTPSAYQYDACKYFGLFGVCDEQNSIAWLYYEDFDRDFIAASDEDLEEEMRELIDDEFHWEPFTK